MLRELRAALHLVREGARRTAWVTPLHIGGGNGTHHSNTLRRLCKRGEVEKQQRKTLTNFLGGGRGSYRYRITDEGLRALKEIEGRLETPKEGRTCSS